MERLKGKTIGLPFLGGPQDFLVHVLCQKLGLVYGKDITTKNMGREFAKLIAITNNTVDAITSAAPNSKLKEFNLNIVADPRTWDEPAPYMMIVSSRETLQKERDTALAFMRSLAAAQEFYLTNKKDSLAILGVTSNMWANSCAEGRRYSIGR